MDKYLNAFIEAFSGTLNWTINCITFDVPWYTNYFWGLVVISLAVWALELAFPWRKKQKPVRKDFWLDGFYMFFNFFIFSIAIAGFYAFIETLAGDFGFTMSSLSFLNLQALPAWLGLIIFFIINDFVQWFTHVLLHRYEFFWQFHKVHHSVKEMGFAAHLRYHWMENILYKPLKTLAVMIIIGGEPEQAFIVHFIAITIGHLNHANVNWTYGPLKYVFNNPVMHLWHHVKALPKGQMPGVNFGISLSFWDYIFGTNYIDDTQNGEIELGFDDIDEFPEDFLGQLTYGIVPRKKKS
ncbi:MAG: sterol desaturase family protein [Bacteroidia bacterium]